MHVLDINRCYFDWFFPLLFFCSLLILFFPLKHCSMEFVWTKISPVFHSHGWIVLLWLPLTASSWGVHNPWRLPCLFWIFLGAGAGKSLSIRGGKEGRWLSPGVTLWLRFSLPLIFYKLTDQRVFHRTKFLSCSLSCGQLKIGFAQKRQRTWFLNFLSQWCSPVFQLPGSPREEHFLSLQAHTSTPPALALACTGKLNKKKSSAVDKNPGFFCTNIWEVSLEDVYLGLVN